MPSTVLSIDWDFFLYRACEAPKIPRVTSPDGVRFSLAGLFDWGHTEAHSELLQQIIWQTRWTAFDLAGLDTLKLTGWGEHADTSPEAFVAQLKEVYGPMNPEVHISDSHRWGYDTLKLAQFATGEPVHVVHFDAHHDLGYDLERVKKHVDEEIVCAEDWLYHALRDGFIESLTVVYPNWRGLAEYKAWGEMRKLLDCHIAKGREITFMKYSEWCRTGKSRGILEYAHIARSSAWSPPWFDQAFADFVQSFPSFETLCVDCLYENPFNACKPRPWSAPPPCPSFASFVSPK